MSDWSPLTKKPRALHPRQRGHTNKHQQQPRSKQHQKQLSQQQPHQHSSQKRILPTQKSLIDDGLPKRNDFPEKPQRLSIQSERDQLSLKENPQFITSLDYSIKPEFNKCRLEETTTMVYSITKENITIATLMLPVYPEFSMVHRLNLLRIRNRNVEDRSYEVAIKNFDNIRISILFEQLTAFPKVDDIDSANVDAKPEENLEVGTVGPNSSIAENANFRKQLWESENAHMGLLSKMRQLEISAKNSKREKEALRRKLLISNQTLTNQHQQQKDLTMKANLLIDTNRKLADVMKALKSKRNSSGQLMIKILKFWS